MDRRAARRAWRIDAERSDCWRLPLSTHGIDAWMHEIGQDA